MTWNSCRSAPTFVSDRPSVSIRLLGIQHDYCIASDDKWNTPLLKVLRSVSFNVTSLLQASNQTFPSVMSLLKACNKNVRENATDIVLSSSLLILSTVTWCCYCWHWACVRLFTRLVVAKATKWNCMKNIFYYSLFCSAFHCSKYFQNHRFNLKNICFFHTWRRINVLSNIDHGG